MPNWTEVARRESLSRDDSMFVDTAAGRLALFDVDGEVFTVENRCPHAGAQLYQGFVEAGRVICPFHGWSFPLVEDEPLCDGLLRFESRVENGAILVDLDHPRLP